MEDIRVNREGGATVKTVTVANADTLLCEYNPHRTALVLAETQGTVCYVQPGQQAANQQGIPLVAAMPPVILTLQEHGKMVCQEWHGFGTASTTVNVTETILNKD